MNTQTFSQAQNKIEQLQNQIDQLQLKPLFSVTLSDKGTATVTKSGALVIHKGSYFTYCGYFKDVYDSDNKHCYSFIYDERLPESILVNHEQAKNLKAFSKNLGEFFATHKGYNTSYTYNNYINRLNKQYLDNIESSFSTYTALKKAGYKLINF